MSISNIIMIAVIMIPVIYTEYQLHAHVN